MGFDKVAASGQESVSRLALNTARWEPAPQTMISGAAVSRNRSLPVGRAHGGKWIEVKQLADRHAEQADEARCMISESWMEPLDSLLGLSEDAA